MSLQLHPFIKKQRIKGVGGGVCLKMNQVPPNVTWRSVESNNIKLKLVLELKKKYKT
jgi:hypothetical protein